MQRDWTEEVISGIVSITLPIRMDVSKILPFSRDMSWQETGH